ncbi:MAG TPA: hypothetical protein VG672_08275 [Bryobacteraceae bacterium]|jgi:hypothetical protein|nr:hypothetical protein [Bryobacteraceae bacterium]
MNPGPVTVSPEAKRFALQQVLQSDTFARADQLKRFLSYVCEMEIQGHGDGITEYQIGMEALGKSEDFSPADDTSVRNRAYALRKKLEKYYEEEDPQAPVRIEFVKGTYVPRFVEAGHAHSNHSSLKQALPSPRTRRFALPLFMLLLGITVGSLVTLWVRRQPSASAGAIAPILQEAWSPILQSNEEVLISLGTPAQMTLLPFDVKMEWKPELPPFEAPMQLLPWYVRHHRLFSGNRLYMVPDVNSPHFGDALGATTVARFLAAAGRSYKLLPERVVPSALLSSRASVLFGVPYKSEAILKLLEKTPFQFSYQPELRDVAITYRASPESPVKVYMPARDERNDRVLSYSLITVMPRDSGDGRVGRVVAFSGDPSAGAAAAAEFFSSPRHLADFRNRLTAAGYRTWPTAYQILLRCKVDSNLPASFSYEAHAVIR